MIFLITTSSLFTACNIVLRVKKKEKAKSEAQKMFSEHGYELDEKTANKLMRIFLGESNVEALDGIIDNYTELFTQFIPGMNIYYIVQNALYLKGKKSTQKYYDNYSNWQLYDRTLSDGEKPLEILEEIGLKKVKEEPIIKQNNYKKDNFTNNMPYFDYSYSNISEENKDPELTLKLK